MYILEEGEAVIDLIEVWDEDVSDWFQLEL